MNGQFKEVMVCFIISFSLLQCGESSDSLKALLSEGEPLEREKAILNIDSSSEQKIAYSGTDSSQVISGSYAVFPIGSFISQKNHKNNDIDVYLEPGSLNLYKDVNKDISSTETIEIETAAPAVMIYPSDKVTLSSPFSVAIPLPKSSALSLLALADNIAVFYQVMDFEKNEIRSGVKLKSSLTLADNGNFLILKTSFFGSFQAVYTKKALSTEIEEKSKSSEIKSSLDSKVIFETLTQTPSPEAPTVLTLSIEPEAVSLAKDSTQAITLTAQYSDGSSKVITDNKDVSWTLGDESKLSLSSSSPKTITAIASSLGSVVSLTASFAGKTASMNITSYECTHQKKLAIYLDANHDEVIDDETSYLDDIQAYSKTDITASDNYGYSSSSVNLTLGPSLGSKKFTSFFFEGSDGLSIFFISSKENSNVGTDYLDLKIKVHNNSVTDNVLVTDDNANEFARDSSSSELSEYTADFAYGDNADGGVIGPLDISSDNFKITVKVTKVPNHINEAYFHSASGQNFALLTSENKLASYILKYRTFETCQ